MDSDQTKDGKYYDLTSSERTGNTLWCHRQIYKKKKESH